MKDFLNGYYGAAGPYLYEYIKMMEAELKKSGRRLSMDGEPESHKMGYLSEECVKKYNELFDKAEKSVWNKQEVLARVQKEWGLCMFSYVWNMVAYLNEEKFYNG